MMLSDPEFREIMTEILGEMAGTPFEGMRTLDPGSAKATDSRLTGRTSERASGFGR